MGGFRHRIPFDLLLKLHYGPIEEFVAALEPE